MGKDLLWHEDSLKALHLKNIFWKENPPKVFYERMLFKKMSVEKKEDAFGKTPSNGQKKFAESNIWKYDLLRVLKLKLYSKGIWKLDRLKFFYEWIPFKDLQLKKWFSKVFHAERRHLGSSVGKRSLEGLLWKEGSKDFWKENPPKRSLIKEGFLNIYCGKKSFKGRPSKGLPWK